MSRHLELGKQGEKLARNWLEKKGWKILEMNWRFGKAEIDIIAQDPYGLVMIEVKTRSSGIQLPEGAVNRKKQSLMANAAAQYIYDTNWQGECRFDVLAIFMLPGRQPEIEHFEDAFYPNPTDDL